MAASAACAATGVATIKVVSATYGENCGARLGNATRDLASHCDSRLVCAYRIDRAILEDTDRACPKNFLSEWLCGDTEFHTAALSPGVESGSTLVLTCIRAVGAGK
ncbi:hypothetical protein B0G84_7675 [Paraburkholderia sp. BL8N3]|nr:hypothetical protein B0G84_7675 [Paraburkholderia sp. BL8N3]